MNPLGTLPSSTSPQFSLNKLDWKKIGRTMLVQLAGFALTFIPMLAGFRYAYKGIDYTPVVIIAVNGIAETLRRYVASNTPAQ